MDSGTDSEDLPASHAGFGRSTVPEKSPGEFSRTNGAASPEGAENGGAAKSPRIPPPFDAIQANYCRNAACVNFAVPPLPSVSRGRMKAGGERISDGYRVVGSKTGEADVRRLRCMRCGAETFLRSNQAIAEELQRLDKDRTVDERKRLMAETAAELDRTRLKLKKPLLTDWEVRRILIRQQLEAFDPSLPWRRRWVVHPVHTMYEPEKAICHASDRGDLDPDHVAALMDRASLHGIDRFFMQLRRMLSPLERPISTPSNVGRVWRGYSPYNPVMVQQLIDIYRVYYNYAKLGDPWKGVEGVIRPRATPAMRLGLARGLVRVEDILYFGR